MMTSDQTYNFHRLYGDYYGNGQITGADSALLSADYGISSTSSKYLWYMDVDQDGYINFDDLLAMAQDGGDTFTDTAAGPIFIGASTTEGAGSGMVLESLAPRDFYYTSQWQVIQETASNPATGGMQTADQYVWGIAYVNELVLRDSDSDGSSSTGTYGITGSGLDQRVYALQDANYNVTALVGLVSGTWSIQERFSYTSYGIQTVLNASGAQTTDSYNWIDGFQGGMRDAVTGLIGFQHRYYDPQTGTWKTQDPTGAAGSGTNLYQMEDSDPINEKDPMGLTGGQGPTGPGKTPSQPEPPEGPNGPGGPIGLPPGHNWLPNNPPAPGRRQGYHPSPGIPMPGGGQPGISWDPQGHWDLKPGDGGPTEHFDPQGNPIPPEIAHPSMGIDRNTLNKTAQNACKATAAGGIIWVIIIIVGAPVGA